MEAGKQTEATARPRKAEGLFLIAGIAYWSYVNLLFSSSSIHPVNVIAEPDAVWFFSLFGNLFALLLVALRPRRAGGIVANSGWVVVSCSFVVVGALMLFAIAQNMLDARLLPLAGALAGFGTGFTFVFFAELFAGMKLQMVLLYSGAQQLFGVLLYLAIATLMPLAVLVLIVALVVCQSVLFAKIGARTTNHESRTVLSSWSSGTSALAFFVAAALLVGGCYGFVRALTLDFALQVAPAPIDTLGGLGGGALLILSALLFIKKNPLDYLYQIAVPVLALGLLAVPLLASGIAAALPILLTCSSYFYGLLWFFIVVASIGSDTPLTRFAAIAFFCFQLGQLGGDALGFVVPNVPAGAYAISMVALFSIVIILVLALSRQKKAEMSMLQKAEEEQFELGCERVAVRHDLTQRESEVFRLLALGVNAKQIAKRLVLSENTVKTHVRHVYQKLGIHSREEIDNLLASEVSDIARDEAPLPLPFHDKKPLNR